LEINQNVSPKENQINRKAISRYIINSTWSINKTVIKKHKQFVQGTLRIRNYFVFCDF